MGMDEIMQEEKSEVKKEGKGRGKDPRKAPISSTPYVWIRNEKLEKKKKKVRAEKTVQRG